MFIGHIKALIVKKKEIFGLRNKVKIKKVKQIRALNGSVRFLGRGQACARLHARLYLRQPYAQQTQLCRTGEYEHHGRSRFSI